jgi:RHH-type proline utilization regulon transcriptional repressor/proline dehydrogenase/delta 1-pyrroline-5-carboxylate dehydrogenase
VQDDIADKVIGMLAGAMDTLVVGYPADARTDVGPVIDQAAYDRLMGHRAAMQNRWLKTIAAPADGLFVPPTLIGVEKLEDVRREWFGPLLHVASWKAGQLAETVRRVNGTGFGLTMGLHSRIARAAETVEETATVGNLYVNRSMIGAIVGSQPFGGEGLSGTGPKAGGPHYVARFATERVTCIDTTAAGGNASLMAALEG